jgi:ribonucleoside-diphosphate reductase alpha chain
MNADVEKAYDGVFFSERSTTIMRSGNILTNGASPADLMAELAIRLARTELSMGENESDTDAVISTFYDYVRRGLCALGSPLLTNIVARHTTLGSCSAVPVRVERLSPADLDLAEAYYRLNMGSGYNLSATSDPCAALTTLNHHAAQVEKSGSCERYIGNIAHLDVTHPMIMDFISLKTGRTDLIHFNTSVNLTQEFMAALETNGNLVLSDGRQIPPAKSGTP